MQWLKRLSPILLLLLGVGAAGVWWTQSKAQQGRERHTMALVFAQTWLASGRYYNQPDSFKLCRDSILDASNVDSSTVAAFRAKLDKEPETGLAFAEEVSRLVDSIRAVKP